MAVGDLTATAIYTGSGSSTGLDTAISSANLAAATDSIFIIPIGGRDNKVKVIKVERAAA